MVSIRGSAAVLANRINSRIRCCSWQLHRTADPLLLFLLMESLRGSAAVADGIDSLLLLLFRCCFVVAVVVVLLLLIWNYVAAAAAVAIAVAAADRSDRLIRGINQRN